MKAPPEVVAKVRDALLAEGAGPGNSIHSWRCEYPDQYGPCDCVAEAAREIANAAVAPIAAQALRDWIDEWPTTPGDGTFLANVARDGLARADRIEATA